jgi:polar amino acid transport system substrate-binding protein
MRFLKMLMIPLCVLCITSTVHAQSQKKLVFAVTENSTNIVNAYYEFLKEVYGELGYQVDMARYPLKRTYAYANSGKVDGVLIMPKDILPSLPNVFPIPTPIAQIDLMVYTVNKKFEIKGPASIKPYKVAILRGYPLSLAITKKLNMEPHVLNDYESLFKVLKAGRSDIALAMRSETDRFFKANPGYADIKVLEPPLFVLPLYHALNKKHQALGEQVAPIFKKRKEDGTFARIYAPYNK